VYGAGVLAVVGVTCLVLGLHRPTAPAEAATRQPQASSSTAPSASPRARPVAAPAPPVRLSIPALGLSKRLLRLGVNKDGTVEVPSSADADLPGWFELGSRPGATGSAVMLGHVDSLRGPAVFYGLRTLARGDRVDVRLDDGTLARFRVDHVATYANEKFPARKVYAATGFAGLNLVTCGGAYDKDTGYRSNVVVFTRLVRTVPAGAASRS
jgi:hypothetical protein